MERATRWTQHILTMTYTKILGRVLYSRIQLNGILQSELMPDEIQIAVRSLLSEMAHGEID